MRVSRKIVSILLVAELFVINSFTKHSMAARGRRVRGATAPAAAEVVNPFAGSEVTSPSSSDSLMQLQEQLNATSENLETQSNTVVDTDSGVVVQSKSVVEGSEDVVISPVDMANSDEFKDVKKSLKDICSEGSSAPMYLGCFNKYKLESAFIEAIEENDIPESFDVVSLEEEVNKMILKKKIALCADGEGKWKDAKETCEYKVLYKREGQVAEKWFEVGKKFMCGYETFGLRIKREKIDDSAVKFARISGIIQTGLATATMVSNSNISFKGKEGKRKEALDSLSDKDKEKYNVAENADLNTISAAINKRNKNNAVEAIDKNDYKNKYGGFNEEAYRAAKIKAKNSSSTYNSSNEFDVDLDSFDMVATGVGDMVSASIEHKAAQRDADQIYGMCEFGNDLIPEENTVRIDWIY